jgi:glucosamine-6-phosphate deaminase
MYKRLIRMYRRAELDCSRVVTFNLDEYIGLAPSHPQSYHYFMHRHFFDHVNVRSRSIHIPDGSVRNNYESYCKQYERAIRH